MRSIYPFTVHVWAMCLLSFALAGEWSAPGQTKVVGVNPPDGATNVNLEATVEIHFSNGLKLTSISPESIQLLDSAGLAVSARLGSDIEADVVNIQLAEPLKARSAYTIEINRKLIDKEGEPVTPFRSSFRTGSDKSVRVRTEGFQFTKTRVDDEGGPTALAVGPDGHVYVGTYNGKFYRLQIDVQTGLSIGKEKLLELPGQRKILGLTFDPDATAMNPVAWITHDERKAENVDQGTFSGVVSRLHVPPAGISGMAAETRYIIGLPSGWHPLNGCAFGPDKRLYISVGSMNRLGHDPVRPETPLSSAVVVADVRSAGFKAEKLPLNVQTAEPVNYDPFAPGALLKLYATGFREMYRLCWHSNGNLYGGVNQNDGTGRADTPSAPGVPSLRSVFPDEDLVRIVKGGYYGHPNPSREQYVLLGGNPTAGVDPWEVPEYPVGVQPDPAFNPANLIFNLKTIDGTSANGCAEYTQTGPLKGRLLVCLFEGTHTIHTFAFNATGTVVTDDQPLVDEKGNSLRFMQPLDVTVHPSGRIYIADFGQWSSFGGGGGIWMLNPVASLTTAAARPLKVIFDTDIDGDNDDVAATAILHACADAGRVDILAMGVVSRHPYSPACLDAINTYYGRGDIPIGVYKGSELALHGSSYAKVVAERCPNDVGLSEKVPDVLDVYRRALAAQSDGKVILIAVGQMDNLVNLLRSKPDEHSDLTGRELARRKIAVLFVMAPYFNERNDYQRAYNFTSSPKTAVELVENWPTPIKFGEGNLGHRHFIGSRLSATPAHNPARIAFEAYFAGSTENKRHCADPTTVLYAVTGTQYFGEVGPGACDVREDGYTRWNAGRNKQHFYNTRKLPIAELEEVMEQLLVTGPKHGMR